MLCHLIRQCTRQNGSHLRLVCLILLKLQGIHTVQRLPKEQTHPQQPEAEKPGWDFVPTPGLGWFYGEFPHHQRVMKIFILGVGWVEVREMQGGVFYVQVSSSLQLWVCPLKHHVAVIGEMPLKAHCRGRCNWSQWFTAAWSRSCINFSAWEGLIPPLPQIQSKWRTYLVLHNSSCSGSELAVSTAFSTGFGWVLVWWVFFGSFLQPYKGKMEILWKTPCQLSTRAGVFLSKQLIPASHHMVLVNML